RRAARKIHFDLQKDKARLASCARPYVQRDLISLGSKKSVGKPAFLTLRFHGLKFSGGFLTAHNETIPSSLAQLEKDVEERSGVLKKELGLFDLVLTQIVFVVGTIWVGWAAKLGADQTFFWLLAIVTFYLPLAAVVIFL